MLRQEVFADDGLPEAEHPYTVAETSYEVRRVQPKAAHRFGSFLVVDHQSKSCAYERNPSDPRVSHELALRVDRYGNVVRSAAIAYARRTPEHDEQGRTHIVVTERDLLHDDELEDQLHLALPTAERSWEFTGLAATAPGAFEPGEVDQAFEDAEQLEFETPPTVGAQRRKFRERRIAYYDDTLTAGLPFGRVGKRALVHQHYTWAFAQRLVEAIYGIDVSAGVLAEAGYMPLADSPDWWIPSGTNQFEPDSFFQPTATTDPFGFSTRILWDDHHLLPIEIRDALENTVRAQVDYRLLTPWEITDPNGQRTQAGFDALGRVVKTAVVGKEGEGDTLEDPTTTITYEDDRWWQLGEPVRVHLRQREEHQNANTRWLEQHAYSDGGGTTVLVKARVAPGRAPVRDTEGRVVLQEDGKLAMADARIRWVGTGQTVLDNKGNPVKQYEPYFDSSAEFTRELELVRWGVTPVLHYDPLGRAIRTDLPDGTFTRTAFTPWEQRAWDSSDTVLDSDWYAERTGSDASDEDRRAASLSAAHHDTPLTTVQDSLGRTFLIREDNCDTHTYDTRIRFDISGHPEVITDARGNDTQSQRFDAVGRPLHTDSPDAGYSRVFPDVMGQPLQVWKAGDLSVEHRYDVLRRKVATIVKEHCQERVAETFVFGDALDLPQERNLRGQLYRVYDGAGLVETSSYDFAGRPVSTTRTFSRDVDRDVDWRDVVHVDNIDELDAAGRGQLLEERFTTALTYDALGRVVTQTTPDDSVTMHTYDEGGGLFAIDVKLRGHATSKAVVRAIRYSSHGRRESIAYSQGTGPDSDAFSTEYSYDPRTQRLSELVTRRHRDDKVLQHWNYTYDASGNQVQITNSVHDDVYFRNGATSATARYTYDALHRLKTAEGRELANLEQTDHSEFDPGPLPATSANETVSYVQSYVYDEVGNIREMKHQGGSEGEALGQVRWRRQYEYADDSNRLLSTSLPGDRAAPFSARYLHSVRGALIAMPHLPVMRRDWRDQVRRVERNLAEDHAVYQYDARGQRVRRVVRFGGAVKERLYVGDFEVFRERTAHDVRLERETLQVMDG